MKEAMTRQELAGRVGIAIQFSLLFGFAAHAADGKAEFHGKVVVEWLEDDKGADRDMRLLEPFEFIDARGVPWPVPAGTIINGASIPRLFWTAVGSPFTGDYRLASVVHDYYCQTKDRPWEDVHRMFYEGMVAKDVWNAKVLYAAVYGGGPRWTRVAGAQPGDALLVITSTPNLEESEFQELETWIKQTDPSLAAIEERVQAMVSQ